MTLRVCVFVRVIGTERAKALDPLVISHTFNINTLTNARLLTSLDVREYENLSVRIETSIKERGESD